MIISYDDVANNSHKLKVLSYINDQLYHHCFHEETKTNVAIDLMVSGDFPDDFYPQSLVGKTIELDYSHACTYIGVGVRELQK